MKQVPHPSGISWNDEKMSKEFMRELISMQLQTLDKHTDDANTVSLRVGGEKRQGYIAGAFSMSFDMSMFVEYVDSEGRLFYLLFTQKDSDGKWELAKEAVMFEKHELDADGNPRDDGTLSSVILRHLATIIL